MENFKIMWVRENYKKLICNPDDIQSVVVGGSVARNYPDDEGDIDIIYEESGYVQEGKKS